MTTTQKYGPSSAAIEAAHCEYHDRMDRTQDREVGPMVADVVAAAHKPALGLDRSVCLRDVVEVVRRMHVYDFDDVRGYIEREFGAE